MSESESDSATAVHVVFESEAKIYEACSTDKTQPVLTGVYIDPAGLAVASDGFILAIVQLSKFEVVRGQFNGATIPGELVRKAFKQAPRYSSPEIHLLQPTDNPRNHGTARAFVKDGVLEAALIDGSFPTWRTILPESFTSAPAPKLSFNSFSARRLAAALGLEGMLSLYTEARDPNRLIAYTDRGNRIGVMMGLFFTAASEDTITARLKAIRAEPCPTVTL